MTNLPLSKDLNYQLFVFLRQAAHVVYRARDNELRKLKTSVEECAVFFIAQSIGDRATPAEIARWMIRERHSMFALLNRMKKKNLITMNKDLDKKNLVRVRLTKKGKQVYESSVKMESFNTITSSLPEETRLQLLSYLRTLRDKAMEELKLDYKPPFP